MASHIIPVSLGDRSYEVAVGGGGLEELGRRMVTAVGQTTRAFVVVDAGLPLATVDVAHASLARTGCRVDLGTVRPEEATKTAPIWARLCEQVAAAGLERGDPIVALGGGIVGDMAGFVAATYRRGAPFVQCPTTLLAMVDAAVGGKTGVNLILKREAAPALLLKNMIGAFYQPSLVLADVSVLRTLPERQFRSGLAECIKHGLLSADFEDPGLLDWIEANAAAILARDERVLVELIARNVAVKAAVVAADERELAGEGGRALLNLGHTFAHALEALGAIDADGHQQPTQAEGGEQDVPRGTSVPSAHLEGEQGHPVGGPEPLLHGEAVGLGILCAVRLAESLGRPIGGLRDRIAALLEEFGLPASLPSLPDMDVVLERMGHDKKARGGSLRFVVPEGAGRCAMVAVSDRNTIAGAVKSLVSGGR